MGEGKDPGGKQNIIGKDPQDPIDPGTLNKAATPRPVPLGYRLPLLGSDPEGTTDRFVLGIKKSLLRYETKGWSRSPASWIVTAVDAEKLAGFSEQEMKEHCINHAREMVSAVRLKSWETTFKMGIIPNGLMADMLDMYLAGKYDQAVIDKVRAELLDSEFYRAIRPRIVAEMNKIAWEAALEGRYPEASVVRSRLAKFLAQYPHRKFELSDRNLQAVIGGWPGPELVDVRIDTSVSTTTASPGVGWTVTFGVRDTYDFDNVRSAPGEKAYDEFRQHLLTLLKKGKYEDFYLNYYEYLLHETGAKEGVTRPRTFASFIYAIEMMGWTKGIAWGVTFPVEGRFAPPPLPRKTFGYANLLEDSRKGQNAARARAGSTKVHACPCPETVVAEGEADGEGTSANEADAVSLAKSDAMGRARKAAAAAKSKHACRKPCTPSFDDEVQPAEAGRVSTKPNRDNPRVTMYTATARARWKLFLECKRGPGD